MNILVVNDDGYKAEGIKILVEKLSKSHDVYVVAPEGQRSATSHAISCSESVKFNEIDFPNAKKAYSITGFPADCVKVGIELLGSQGVKIQMVFSGINHGSNLGLDTHYSGTVGAAMEGAFNDIPAVALSVVSHDAKHFEYISDLALKMSKDDNVFSKKNIVFNVNAPNVPADQIKGIKISSLGRLHYREVFENDGMSDCKYTYCKVPNARFEDIEGSDAYNIKRGYVTITPIYYDFTSFYDIDAMKGWNTYEI